MSFKLRKLFAAVSAVLGARMAAAAVPQMPTVLVKAPSSTTSNGGSAKSSRRKAAANRAKALRYAKRSTRRARGHASRHS